MMRPLETLAAGANAAAPTARLTHNPKRCGTASDLAPASDGPQADWDGAEKHGVASEPAVFF